MGTPLPYHAHASSALASTFALGGMVTAPHHLAAQAGAEILKQGGTALEAMVAAAAAIAVVYPHMNSMGGDGFWLFHNPDAPAGQRVCGIDASGRSGERVRLDQYADVADIPIRGARAAITMAGAVSGWQQALAYSATMQPPLPLETILAPAIRHAEMGVPRAQSLDVFLRDRGQEVPDVLPVFAPDIQNGAPEVGHIVRQPALAATLRTLAADGLDSFYRGVVAVRIHEDLQAQNCILTQDDFQSHQANIVAPLSVSAFGAQVFNMPPPTQGVSALHILAGMAQMNPQQPDGFDHIHAALEATKCAFKLRNAAVTDPQNMAENAQDWLQSAYLAQLFAGIDPAQAAPWGEPPQKGGTVWMGCVDAKGRAVSYIQSIFHGFGSGVFLPQTGIVWQNRGAGFSLDPAAANVLAPRKKTRHTLNPALALFADGRSMVYGTMGGDGQPQTQAAIFSRIAHFGYGVQAAVSAPRWLLGQTWEGSPDDVKVENRIDPGVIAQLRAAGHKIVLRDAFDEVLGHAGAILRHRSGALEGAADPRSDGCVASV